MALALLLSGQLSQFTPEYLFRALLTGSMHMGISANTRYQIVNGIERVLYGILPQGAARGRERRDEVGKQLVGGSTVDCHDEYHGIGVMIARTGPPFLYEISTSRLRNHSLLHYRSPSPSALRAAFNRRARRRRRGTSRGRATLRRFSFPSPSPVSSASRSCHANIADSDATRIARLVFQLAGSPPGGSAYSARRRRSASAKTALAADVRSPPPTIDSARAATRAPTSVSPSSLAASPAARTGFETPPRSR